MIYGIVAIVASLIIGGGYYWLNDTFDKAGKYDQCKVDLDASIQAEVDLMAMANKQIENVAKACEAGKKVDKMKKDFRDFSKEIKNLEGDEKKKAIEEQRRRAYEIAKEHTKITR